MDAAVHGSGSAFRIPYLRGYVYVYMHRYVYTYTYTFMRMYIYIYKTRIHGKKKYMPMSAAFAKAKGGPTWGPEAFSIYLVTVLTNQS